jgi:hypothetical protein
VIVIRETWSIRYASTSNGHEIVRVLYCDDELGR